MKKLLALTLTAFILCITAVGSFALTESGYGTNPLFSTYATYNDIVPQNNGGGAYKTVFTTDKCPYCLKNVSIYNTLIPASIIDSMSTSPINDGFGSLAYSGTLVAGSYWTYNRYGYKPDTYVVAQIRDTCTFDSSQDLKGYVIIYERVTIDNVEYVKLGTHYTMYNGTVQGGYYISVFSSGRNDVATSVVNESISWRTSYENNSNLDIYTGRVVDFCIRNYATSVYPEMDTPSISEDAYNEGYNAGAEGTDSSIYNEGYKDGYNVGFGKGQDETSFDFVKLFDGVFSGFSSFLQPILSIGIGNITIASMIAIVGLAFITLLIVKIIRG